MTRYVSAAAATPATTAAAAACSGEGLSPPARLANALFSTPDTQAQLLLEERRRDDDPLERFELELLPLPLVDPRERLFDDDRPLPDQPLLLRLRCDEPPDDFESSLDRDDEPERAALSSRSLGAPAPRVKRPVLSRGSSSSSSSSSFFEAPGFCSSSPESSSESSSSSGARS